MPKETTMSRKKTPVLVIAFISALALGLPGQDGSDKVSAQTSESYAIRNARIVTVSGPVIESGTVVISAGKIAAVGADVSVPPGAKVIDAKGLSVYPGMIDADTEIGLTEIGSVAGSVDTNEIGDNNANIHVDVAIRPDSSHIAVTRVNGVTTALSAPRGGLIAGQSALLNLDGWTSREMILKSPVAMHINWPGGGGRNFEGGFGGPQRSVTELRREQDRQLDNLRKILRDAAAYGDAKDARAKDASLPKRDVDLKLEALIPVVRGLIPVVINVNMERDIKSAIAFVGEM